MKRKRSAPKKKPEVTKADPAENNDDDEVTPLGAWSTHHGPKDWGDETKPDDWAPDTGPKQWGDTTKPEDWHPD